MEIKRIFLDFDGTIVEHAYPEIGRYNPYAFDVIKKLQDHGHNIILNTTRVNFNNGSLQAALSYLTNNPYVKGIDIKLHTPRKLNPTPWHKDLLKTADTIFIDDMADGIPSIPTAVHGDMVDWKEIEKQFIEAGIIADYNTDF